MLVKIPEGHVGWSLCPKEGFFQVSFERDEVGLVLETSEDDLGRTTLSVLVSNSVCEVLKEEVESL